MAMASLQPSCFSSLSLFPSSNPHPSKPFKLLSSLNSPETSPVDPAKLAVDNAKAYKKNPTPGNKGLPPALKTALERAKEYKQKKHNGTKASPVTGVESVEKSKGKLSVSSMDFVGLGFADKKEGRAVPAGLVPFADDFSEGNKLPEVEIIVGDSSNFGARASKPEQQAQGDDPDLYKPRVSSWGVFPRPNDISKTFGGGRVIRPGEVLETEEEKAAKEARTRQLVAAYKNKMGLNIDPKLRLDCEKTLKDGDSLMNVGKLKEALPYYEKVMDKLPFKSDLHGLAALQWSICQDSLSRTKEARNMYERLQSHPTARVSKKARQFMFSFQAMEMMKLTKSSPWRNTDYQNFFEAFIDNKSDYVLEDGEVEVGTMSQIFPYILFLVSPIFIVVLIAIQKRV